MILIYFNSLEYVKYQIPSTFSSMLFNGGQLNHILLCSLNRLFGNPVCIQVPSLPYCQRQLQEPSHEACTTSLANCEETQCPSGQKLIPKCCDCAYPYEGKLSVRAPRFSDLTSTTRFESLESSLWTKLHLNPGFVLLHEIHFISDDHLVVQLALFPTHGKYFSPLEISKFGFDLSKQTYKPPRFGPYYFLSTPYTYPGE